MNRYAVILVVAITLAISAVNAVPAGEEPLNDAVTAELFNTIAEKHGTQFVTPFRSVLLGHLSKIDCWVCSAPCNMGFCCDDGYPQCCQVNGVCGCCRGK